MGLTAYRPTRINNRGEWITLGIGQLMAALPFLAKRWMGRNALCLITAGIWRAT